VFAELSPGAQGDMSGELPAGLRDLLKLAKSPAAPPRRADTVICAASLSKQVTLPA
jgi:hypothetical protein